MFAPVGAAALSLPYDAIQAYTRMKPDSGIKGYFDAFMAENPFSSLAERTYGATLPLAERISEAIGQPMTATEDVSLADTSAQQPDNSVADNYLYNIGRFVSDNQVGPQALLQKYLDLGGTMKSTLRPEGKSSMVFTSPTDEYYQYYQKPGTLQTGALSIPFLSSTGEMIKSYNPDTSMATKFSGETVYAPTLGQSTGFGSDLSNSDIYFWDPSREYLPYKQSLAQGGSVGIPYLLGV